MQLKSKTFQYENDRFVYPGVLFNFLEKLQEFLVGSFPIIGSLVVHHEPLIKRSTFSSMYVRKPGVWSLRNIWDAVFFRWLNYQIEGSLAIEDEAHGIVSNFISDQQNIAVVSALFLTVWTSFLTLILGNYQSNAFSLAAMVFFGLASISSLASTLLPVILCMTTGANRLPMDALYFLELLELSTLGLGPQSAILYLNFCSMTATFGVFFLVFSVSDLVTTLIVFAATSVPLFFMFQIYFQIVSCLYCTVKSADRVAYETQPVTFTFEELKNHLEGYLSFNSATTADELSVNCTTDSFVKYIEFNSSPTPIQLNNLTSKRARRLYTTFLEKNMFEKVDVGDLHINSKEDLIESAD